MQLNGSDSQIVPSAARPLDVLLVSDDPRWTASVREAVAAEGGVVETVSARTAVARLASAGTQLSHILVDQNGADGLLGTLADLASDTASAPVTLLVLGAPVSVRGTLGVIESADRQAIADSLAVHRFPANHNEPTLAAAELLEVVSGDMIETRYQPIVRLADRTVTAMEVLARLNHPIHGTVTPDWFVPRFEDAGLSFTLTDMVSTRALADLTSPRFSGLGVAMALNYPLKVLSHPNAAHNLDKRRATLGLTPEQVQIELTESRPVEDFAALGRSLEHLRALGYRISIDDVGPAVKNLARLLTLPFTGLKLDKGITRLIGTHSPGALFGPRVLEQASARGLTVVAEGVETREMWDRLRALGVHEAQGYFIARPLPATAVPVWLEAWRAGMGGEVPESVNHDTEHDVSGTP
jgi:EAL domain-containing protein (putative c-di-GMP-specific phosphodiesterase class I)